MYNGILLLSGVFAKNFMNIPGERSLEQRNLTIIPFKFSKLGSSKSSSGSVGGDYVSQTLVASIAVGSSKQMMSVLIDSGSTLFWVRSSQCKARECVGKSQYDNSKSTSYVKLPQTPPQKLTYGDGTYVECNINQDSIYFGDLAVENQRLCEATNIMTVVPSTDGILGIGPPGGKSGPADFMKTLMAQNSAVGSQIGFWYNVQDSPSAGQGGELTIGGVDPSRYSGAIQYYPLTVDRSYWMLSMDKVILADGSLLGTDFGNAVVDTGTTSFNVPPEIAKQINTSINATMGPQRQYTMDCKTTSNVKALSFFFAGMPNPLKLSGSQLYHYDPLSKTCYSIFQPGTSDSLFLIGAWFLRNYYVVFETKQGSIGFATPTIQPSNLQTQKFPKSSKGLSISNPSLLFSACLLLQYI